MNLIRIIYFFFFTYSILQAEQLETSKNKKPILEDFSIKGSYTENPEDINNLTIINDEYGKTNQLLCLGTIGEIQWNCARYPIEELNKSFPEFAVGKTVNLTTLKYIRFFLKEQLKLDYEFKLLYKKSQPNKVTVILQEKNNLKYTVSKVSIIGNNILTENDILESIIPVVRELDLIEKIKFIFFKQSGSVVNLENLETSVEHFIKLLGERRLLDVKTSITFVKNEKNKTVHIIINIEEGTKYFIRKIILPKNKKIHKRHLNVWIAKHGMENGSFKNIEEFFRDSNIFDLVPFHRIEDNLFIDLFIVPRDEQRGGMMVSMIRYTGFNSISLDYMAKYVPVHIGEYFNEQKMDRCKQEQSQILSTKISYELSQEGPEKKQLIVHLTMEDTATEQKIISAEKNNPVFQYIYHNRLFYHPDWHITVIPKLKISTGIKTKLQPGLMCNLEHRWYNRSLDIINGDFFIDGNAITDSDKKSPWIRSFNARLFTLSNINKKHISWAFTPITFTKYYNAIVTDEKIQKHIYSYMDFYIKRLDIFGQNLRRVKMSNYLSLNYFYGRSFKLNINPELLVPLTKKIQLQMSLKLVGNSHSIDPNNKDIFLHLEMINAKDRANGLLWESHLLFNEMATFPKAVQEYLELKNIILSNGILNFRFMINYVIFKTELAGFGKIQLILFVFYNKVYNISYKLNRDSAGLGLMGVYNNNCALLSVGKKFTEKGLVNQENLEYGLSFDHYAF